MAAFWVYENWQAKGHQATIHKAECPSCNDGRGIHPGASNLHGKWRSAESYAAAEAVAVTTGGAVRQCERCRPRPYLRRWL